MISRRNLLGVAPVALASCARSEAAYFGSTLPPKTRRLIHTLPAEIESFDPAKFTGGWDYYVTSALFEPLTQYHPEQPIPMAALATHYEANADSTQFRFYLRGYPKPRGIRLMTSAELPDTFRGGRKLSNGSLPALWSDGKPITAYDFVYSWRRFMTPETAAPFSHELWILKNAEDVFAGRRPPRELGVHAPDEFTFEVDLRSSTPFFVPFITGKFPAVPMQAVAGARARNAESTWTDPSHIVTSGPFILREHRPYERIVLARNPNYYDASLVGLDELTFLPVVDGTTVLNLYKAGKAAMTASAGLSVLFNPVLSSKKDYHSSPAFATRFPYINTRRPPFDNVLLRYALNMATDKKAVADFYGADYLPARSLIAPLPGYLQPDRLEVDVEGRLYNVLSFDVEGARSLLAKAGYPEGMTEAGGRLEIPYHFPVIPDARPQGEILQQQWLHHLNVRVKLMTREFNVHLKMLKDGDYSGLAEDAIFPLFLDPYGFLKEFPNGSKSAAASEPDLVFSSEVEAANTIPNPAERMRRLAACETRLLKRMSFLPLFHEAYRFLCKPYVKGLGSQPLAETRAFRYAWIDTNWRPQ